MYIQGDIIMVLIVLISLIFIMFVVWYVNKHIGDGFKTKDWLTRYVSLMLASLVGLFIIDKVIGHKTPLLTEEMSEGLFELIKNIVLVVFGYQFGGKIDNDKHYGPR